MRRVLLAVALGASLVAIALVPLVALSDGDGDGDGTGGGRRDGDSGAAGTAASGGADGVGGDRPLSTSSTVVTTPPAGDAIESSGSAPVSGALLSQPFDGAPVAANGGSPCAAVAPGARSVDCRDVRGSGGRFLVATAVMSDGARQALLLRHGDGAFHPVRRSEAFEPDVDVFGLAATEWEVGGESVVVVDYDFDGSGSVHSFDVVAWDAGAPQPRVVATVSGTGLDRFSPRGDALEFVSANYDDGAPTCCPNHAEVRTLRRDAPGRWSLAARVVPWSAAP